jgi:hypothetical protein
MFSPFKTRRHYATRFFTPPINKIFILTIALFTFSLFYVGCDNNLQTSTQPQLRSAEETIRLAKTTGLDTKNIDEEFAYIADLVPGFAGYYYDKDQLVLPMKDLKMRDQTKMVMKERFKLKKLGLGKETDLDIAQTKQANFDFRDLKKGKDFLSEKLKNWIYMDANERTNKVEIGVLKDQDTNSMKQQAKILGFDPEMIEVKITEPIVSTALLTGKIRPVLGGLQIANSTSFCTLGLNVYRDGVLGFITNSHCTAVQGGVSYTSMYQPTAVSSNLFGTETVDPLYNTTGCWSGATHCRQSDSAFISYASLLPSNLVDYGKIATTQNGSLGIVYAGQSISNIPDSYKTITGFLPTAPPSPVNAYSGQLLYKVGRTTGRTAGVVDNTCYNMIQLTNTSRVNSYLCQVSVNADVGAGDSGSAVYALDGGAAIYGLLHSAVGTGAGNTVGHHFSFSPIYDVFADLGGSFSYL